MAPAGEKGFRHEDFVTKGNQGADVPKGPAAFDLSDITTNKTAAPRPRDRRLRAIPAAIGAMPLNLWLRILTKICHIIVINLRSA